MELGGGTEVAPGLVMQITTTAVVRTGALVVTALVLLTASADARADDGPAEEAAPVTTGSDYVRHGFTMELGLGISETAVGSDTQGREHTGLGIAPLSLGMGGFLTPRLALMGRAAGSSYLRDDARGHSYDTVNAFYGATLQYWPTDRFYFGGGPGLALLVSDPYRWGAKDVRFIEVGFGLNARVGFAFALPGDHNALTLGIDAFGSRFEKSSTVATALNLGWQFF